MKPWNLRTIPGCRWGVGRLGVVTAFVLCSLVEAARAAEGSSEPDFVGALENVREVADEARVTLVGMGRARVTVTRTFEAREPSLPVAPFRGFDVPGEGVVTSFELETDGTWRPGRLRRDRPIKAGRGDAGLALARDTRQWGALEWLTGHQVQIETSMFRVRGRFSVRHVLSSRGEPVRRGYRWVLVSGRRQRRGAGGGYRRSTVDTRREARRPVLRPGSRLP